MTDSCRIRAIERHDCPQWRPLWDGYNAFYGRSGPTALPEPIAAATWGRFFDPAEPVHARVAEQAGRALYDKVAPHRGFIVCAYELQ